MATLVKAPKDKRRSVEDELRAVNQRLQMYSRVIDNSRDLISLVDRQYVYRLVNPTYTRYLGRPEDQIVGHTVAEMLGEDLFRTTVGPHLDQCFAGETVTYETEVDLPPVGHRYTEVHYYPLYADGQVEYAVVVSRDITGRKQGEEERERLVREQAARAEAEAARERINNILESITDAFFALDPQNRFTYVNSAAEQLLRRSREDLIGKNIWELYPESVGSDFYHQYQEAISKQTPAEHENFSPMINKWLANRFYPSKEGLSIFARDITLRKRAEEGLRESEERYRLLIESIPDAVWVSDEKGDTAFVPRNIERITGYTPEEFYQGGAELWFGRIHPDDVKRVEVAFDSLLTEKKPFDIEYRYQRKDGRWAWLHDRSIATYEENGVKYARGIVSDITERRRVQEALRESERLLNESQAISKVGGWEYDIETRRFTWTDEVYRIYGVDRSYDPNDLTRAISFYARKDQEIIEQAFRNVVGGQPYDVELQFNAADGSRKWVRTMGRPLIEDGKITKIVGNIMDVTDRKRAEEEREDFIRTVSHDLRNPLAIVRGQAQVIQRYTDKVDLVRKSAAAIVVASGRMNAMIQDLVDSARFEAGQLRLDRQPLGLWYFVSDMLERAKDVMDVGRVKVEIPIDLPPVDADPDRLERILMNLVSNALKYSPPETDIVLGAKLADREAIISVIDRGVGIPAEDLSHIFERFYRASGTRKAEGLGLGLYITRMLVEAHGGRVWAESQFGKGSTFYFTLPLA